MAELGKVLDELVNGRLTKTQLSGGLGLQFKTENGTSKLCAYRIGGLGPSDVELKTLRDHLIALLPNRVIQLGEEFPHKGKDGKARLCRVFSWHTMGPKPTQLGFGAVETAVTVKYE